MTETYSSVAVVVVHYKSPDSLAATVRNLRQHLPADQIVVVDNSASLDREQLDQVIVLSDGDNRGYAGGVNYGIKYVSNNMPHASEILVCTHETLFRDNALQSLLTTACSYPQGHIVAPRLVTADKRGNEITWSNGGFYTFPFLYPKHATRPGASALRTARWVDGAAFLIDLDTWGKLGGIPEEFFMYMEDVALGELCRKHKIPVVVDQRAVVEQTANGPSRHLAIRNRVMLAKRYMGFPRGAVVLFDVALRQVLMAIHPSNVVRQKAAESRSAYHEATKIISDLQH
ncbi:glycosyltransferase family 2 protein [Pseudarthrobacter sp. SL88]|uniref:glycosyltransferase family 2 protein n=1 Tax=Pseudarthrobacter sp. SL88 TaxID=2994666 RepID=UPI0022735052|nr:glycosyltransferase family 2 protein [Pseudarthrobacter sp. SL88]MCY1673815.1 glycosyltransferase family 2 protein [Pseudarthrobacter sp. SL88]